MNLDKLKGKMSIEISARDKKIILVVLSLAIIVAAYIFGFQNFYEKTQSYQAESEKLHATQKDLMEKTQNRDKYEAETESYKKQYNAVFANYGSTVDQDEYLEFLNKIEKITGAWIKGVTFSEAVNVYTFGAVRSTNPSAAGVKVYNTDYEGWKTTLTLSYEATYSQFKQMVVYINDYYSKNAIETISMSYSSDEDKVSGSISLACYTVTGSDRKSVSPVFGLPVGTENIFFSSVFDSTKVDLEDTTGDYILSNYDYYMLLNSSSADLDSCIIGKKGDKTRESIITANSNAKLDVVVTFTGTSGNYKVSYQIGDTTYPATDYNAGASFDPGNTLDFLIMSTPRIDGNDTGLVNLKLVNDTDMNLNVKICNDDTKNSRVSIVSRSGDITIYQ
jgi:hypothetical protein